MFVHLLGLSVFLNTAVLSRCDPPTAALEEKSLRDKQQIPQHQILVAGDQELLNWNCSETSTKADDSSAPPTNSKEMAASESHDSWASWKPSTLEFDVGNEPAGMDPSKQTKTTEDSLDHSEVGDNKPSNTNTTADEPQPRPGSTLNTYAVLYRKVLQSRGLVPQDNETSGFIWDSYGSNQEEQNVSTTPPPERQARDVSEDGSNTVMNCTVSIPMLLGEENGITILNTSHPENSSILNLYRINAYGVDHHYKKSLIFFSGRGGIRRIDSTDKNGTVVARAGVDGHVRLAVDWVHNRIYWMSYKYQLVEVADLDGANRTLLFDTVTNITFPNNIVVDPYQGLLFFVNNKTIYKTDLEGGYLTKLTPKGKEGSVKCLALDIQNRKLYFSGKVANSSCTPYLASCDYDGLQVKDHPLGNTWNDIYSLAVFRDSVLFAHYIPGKADTLWHLGLSGNSTPERVCCASPFQGTLWSIRVYHSGVQELEDE